MGTIRHVTGLETRSGRMKIKPGPSAYWRPIVGSLALGYQRRHSGQSGRWIVRAYLGDERYRKTPLGALADDYSDSNGDTVLNYAEAVERVRQSYHQTGHDSPLSVLTIADAMAEYITWLKTHKASGRDAELRAAKLILPKLGKIRLSDLTTRQIIAWRDALAAQPAMLRSRPGAEQNYRAAPKSADERRGRRATVNRTWTTLRAALNMAFRNGHVGKDIAWKRVTPFKEVTAARPGYLTPEQAMRLVNAADPDFRLLVRGALETGCRFGELAAVKVRDFEGGKLYVAKSKSGHPRSVVLSDAGAAFFTSITVGRDPDALIFQRQGRQWQKSEQGRPMREACQHAGITPAMAFHGLRHTWASLAVMNAMPMLIVARNLGHADTRMVERHYGHLAPSFIDKAIKEHAPDFGFEPPSAKVRPLR
jgi:integrase